MYVRNDGVYPNSRYTLLQQIFYTAVHRLCETIREMGCLNNMKKWDNILKQSNIALYIDQCFVPTIMILFQAKV